MKEQQNKQELELARTTISTKRTADIESDCDIRCCSCTELFKSGIKPDAVITYPPSPEESEEESELCVTQLAEGCNLAQVPLIAVMSSELYMIRLMLMMREHLKYHVTGVTLGDLAVNILESGYSTSRSMAALLVNIQPSPPGQNCPWNLIRSSRGSRTWEQRFSNAADPTDEVARSKPNDKRPHTWNQLESATADLVERLTKPGQLVCDPFVGGGTTAVVSRALGRRFVGCDIDCERVKQVQARVAE